MASSRQAPSLPNSRATPPRLLKRLVTAILSLPRCETAPLYAAFVTPMLQPSAARVVGPAKRATEGEIDVLGTILIVVLILLLIGALPSWGYSRSWGYGPSGGLGLIVIILIVLVLLGRI